jgi:protein-S-isoprenylcysteine O-methyltransferase Ste14
VGKLFRLTLVATTMAVGLYGLVPGGDAWLVPIPWLSHPALQWAGAGLLLAALVWVLVAQAQMGASWRIGIDDQAPAPLVQTGLFAVSRNPIFLGMMTMLVGLVGVLPTAITLAIAVLGLALIHIQVRLEEEFLARTHGQAYAAYRARVRRWL